MYPNFNGPTLTENDVHLWLTFPESIQDPALLESYALLLSDQETDRWQRFHFDEHKKQFLITRALVRTVLSFYTGIDPGAWRFTANRYGRPAIASDMTAIPLRFNVSHTAGLILCGVTLGSDIGVDVENRYRRGVRTDLADRYFAAGEIQDLYLTAEPRRRERFFDYWTLKEAYIKARGMGMSLPLDSFEFRINDPRPTTVSATDPVAGHWRFWRVFPTDRHTAAVAVLSERPADPCLTLKTIIPFVEWSTLDTAIVI